MIAPTLITATANLTPVQLRELLKKVDDLGIPYCFTNTTPNLPGAANMKLRLESDCTSIAGVEIYLSPQGTWWATAEVVIGEKE